MLGPDASLLLIRRIMLDGSAIILEAEGRTAIGRCPSCGACSEQVHDRYHRHPQDLPWRGCQAQLVVTVRRFRCHNPACPRATFAESFGPQLGPFVRRTASARDLLQQLAYSLGGEGGARIADAVGLPASPDTLLRLLRGSSTDPVAAPRVLGVDDFAFRRGRRYGTILVDLETRRPIDLLADREAETFAAWLRAHPGVEIVVRDRAEAYAEGARAGAPAALQVADRFHLAQNASQAMEELLRGRRRQTEISSVEAVPGGTAGFDESHPLSASKQRLVERRAARLGRWDRVRRLHAGGASISQIARETGADRKTVRRLAALPEPPHNRRAPPPPRDLTSPSLRPYVGYLQERWQAGCHNASQLYRDLVAQGYAGSRSLLSQALRPWREPRPPGKRRTLRLRWLCLRPPDTLTPEEDRALHEFLATDPRLTQGYDLLQQFRRVLHARNLVALDRWLSAARDSQLPAFVALANGIQADRAAVEAAFTLPWSTGPVEGHVHRLKLIKRQGYGRAKLDLLRRRVLVA
jgi:transposase